MEASEIWRLVRDTVVSPKVDEAVVDRCLRRARQRLPTPMFWLLGKTQSGKTSVIRALTGSSVAEIGNGFKACTRTAQRYDFPNEQECFLRFLDTRGLGEINYNPDDDIRLFENEAHLLIVVTKAADHAPQALLNPLRSIRKRHPQWPVIVVQTALHELYPAGSKHIEPYPFATTPFPPHVPPNLARSLIAQREWFVGYNARFVPIDFTSPDDKLAPEHYGLDALWSAIEEALPLGLRAMLQKSSQVRKELNDTYFRTAHPHILWYSLAAGGIAAGMPVPLVDMPLVVGVQLKLLHTVASIYGQELSSKRVAEIFGSVVLGLIGRQAGRELLKLIPVLGSAAAAAYAAASTYALGCTYSAYFSYALNGDVPDVKVLKMLYHEQLAEGRRRFEEYFHHNTGETKRP